MDLLNLVSDERVTRSDLAFGLTDAVVGQLSELVQGALVGAGRSCIVSGFVPAAASATGPVTIGNSSTQNSAFLGRNVDGEVVPAQLIYGGNPSVSIDISTFPSGTYGIYVRANRVATQPQNRAFWSGVDAAEYAKLTPTRLTATWEARIETAQPAPEWLKIGEATVTAASSGGQGATVAVVDQRPLLFEGLFNRAYAPAWGAETDRTFRRTATITSMATMVDALKACVVDLKGPGVATWYQNFITGMNIGPALAGKPVTPNRLCVGVPSTYLEIDDPASLYPATRLNVGPDNSLYWDNFTGSMFYISGGASLFSVGGNGNVGINLGQGYQLATSPLSVNSQSTFPGGEIINAFNRGSGNAMVGVWGKSRPELGSMTQYGYIDEIPAPRSYIGIGTTGTNIQAFITLRNDPSSSAHSYIFRAVSNSTTNGDTTTYVNGRAIKIGTTGSVELFGSAVYAQNRRFDGGALGWAAATVGYSDDPNIGGTLTRTALVASASRLTSSENKSYTRVFFNTDLPATAMPMVSCCTTSVSGTDQRGWRVSAHISDARTVDVEMLDASAGFHWGTFYLLIVNGS